MTLHLQAADHARRNIAHYAAHACALPEGGAVRSLLDQYPGLLSARTKDGTLPYQIAASRGNAQMLEYLQSKDGGAICPAPQPRDTSSLQLAAASGSSAAVGALLAAGADVLARDCLGSTALHTALAPGNFGRVSTSESCAIVAALVARAQALTSTHAARSVKYNAEPTASPSPPPSANVHEKAMQLTAAKYLLLARDARGQDCVHFAFELRSNDVLAPLWRVLNPSTDRGALSAADFMLGGRFALHAARSGMRAAALELLRKGHVLSACAGPVLHAACARGDFQLVNYVLRAVVWAAEDAPVPYPDTSAPPLPPYKVPEAAAKLLRRRDPAGWQPLHCAVHSGCWRTVQLLVQAWGAKDIDYAPAPVPVPGTPPATMRALASAADAQPQPRHLNALHLAGYLGSVRIVWLLLVSLYDVRAAGPHGRTLLHYVGLGPLQGTEPWLFSTRPLDADRVVPPCAVQSTDSSTVAREAAYLPYAQLGELALRLGVPLATDALGAHAHHYAAASGNRALYELLAKRSGPVLLAALDHQARGVLHYLCAGGADHMAPCLGDVVATKPGLALFEDAEGRIPLHYAAQVRAHRDCETVPMVLLCTRCCSPHADFRCVRAFWCLSAVCASCGLRAFTVNGNI
jgi:ankyrin repeat protein